MAKQTEIFVKRDSFMFQQSGSLIKNVQFWWFCFCTVVVYWCCVSHCFYLIWFAWLDLLKFIPAGGKKNSLLCKSFAFLIYFFSWSLPYLVSPISLKVLQVSMNTLNLPVSFLIVFSLLRSSDILNSA